MLRTGRRNPDRPVRYRRIPTPRYNNDYEEQEASFQINWFHSILICLLAISVVVGLYFRNDAISIHHRYARLWSIHDTTFQNYMDTLMSKDSITARLEEQVDLERGRRILISCHHGDTREAYVLDEITTVEGIEPEEINPTLTNSEISCYCAREAFKRYRAKPNFDNADDVLHYAEDFGGPTRKIDPNLYLGKIRKFIANTTDKDMRQFGNGHLVRPVQPFPEPRVFKIVPKDPHVNLSPPLFVDPPSHPFNLHEKFFAPTPLAPLPRSTPDLLDDLDPDIFIESV